MKKSGVMAGGVYCILNLSSGKRYVGSAYCFYYRWKAHRVLLNKGKHHSIHLQRAWSKSGAVNFKFLILKVLLGTAKLVHWEQRFIDKFNSANPKCGYNRCPIAGSCLGFRHTAKTCAERSKRQLGRLHTPEAKKKIGQALRGKKKSKEHRAKLRIIGLTRRHSEKSKQKITLGLLRSYQNRSSPMKGSKHTKSARNKMSKARKGVPKSKQHRLNISKALRKYRQQQLMEK